MTDVCKLMLEISPFSNNTFHKKSIIKGLTAICLNNSYNVYYMI